MCPEPNLESQARFDAFVLHMGHFQHPSDVSLEHFKGSYPFVRRVQFDRPVPDCAEVGERAAENNGWGQGLCFDYSVFREEAYEIDPDAFPFSL